MTDHAAHCTDESHCDLAGHILHGVNIGYDGVSITHLNVCDPSGDDDGYWEAEVIIESPTEVAFVVRASCPVEAAISAGVQAIRFFKKTAKDETTKRVN